MEGCHCDRPRGIGARIICSRLRMSSGVALGLAPRMPANLNRSPDARQHSCVERLHHIVPRILRPQAPNDG